jgi:hypothetical protein
MQMWVSKEWFRLYPIELVDEGLEDVLLDHESWLSMFPGYAKASASC